VTWDRKRLLEMVRQVVVRGEVKLSSGKTSNYYINGKRITLDPEGLSLVSGAFLDMLPAEAQAVGGLTLGADPIAAAVCLRAYQTGRRLRAFIVRKETKEHGTQSLLEGDLPYGSKCVVVEDVVTTGGSALKAIEALEEEGHTVLGVLALVDRQEGGTEALSRWRLRSLFTPADLGVLHG